MRCPAAPTPDHLGIDTRPANADAGADGPPGAPSDLCARARGGAAPGPARPAGAGRGASLGGRSCRRSALIDGRLDHLRGGRADRHPRLERLERQPRGSDARPHPRTTSTSSTAPTPRSSTRRTSGRRRWSSVVQDPDVALRAATAGAVVEALVALLPDHPVIGAVRAPAGRAPERRVLAIERVERDWVAGRERGPDRVEVDLPLRGLTQAPQSASVDDSSTGRTSASRRSRAARSGSIVGIGRS
jgi:hypothetical protein